MLSHNRNSEGSSLTGWIVELGGGSDPSWSTSLVRTLAAGFGLVLLHRFNIDYGDLNDIVRLSASLFFGLFFSSLLIKIFKYLNLNAKRKSRLKKAARFYRALRTDEIHLLYKFVSDRTQIMNGNDLVKASTESESKQAKGHIGSLVKIGILKANSYKNRSDVRYYTMADWMWEYMLLMLERGRLGSLYKRVKRLEELESQLQEGAR